MPDDIEAWIERHEAKEYGWHRRLSGTYEAKFGDHEVVLTSLPGGGVLFFWAGPKMRRRYREFKPGERRPQTVENLRRIAGQ